MTQDELHALTGYNFGETVHRDLWDDHPLKSFIRPSQIREFLWDRTAHIKCGNHAWADLFPDRVDAIVAEAVGQRWNLSPEEPRTLQYVSGEDALDLSRRRGDVIDAHEAFARQCAFGSPERIFPLLGEIENPLESGGLLPSGTVVASFRSAEDFRARWFLVLLQHRERQDAELKPFLCATKDCIDRYSAALTAYQTRVNHFNGMGNFLHLRPTPTRPTTERTPAPMTDPDTSSKSDRKADKARRKASKARQAELRRKYVAISEDFRSACEEVDDTVGGLLFALNHYRQSGPDEASQALALQELTVAQGEVRHITKAFRADQKAVIRAAKSLCKGAAANGYKPFWEFPEASEDDDA